MGRYDRGACQYKERLRVATVYRTGLHTNNNVHDLDRSKVPLQLLFTAGLREWPRCRYDRLVKIELEIVEHSFVLEAYAACPRCRRM